MQAETFIPKAPTPARWADRARAMLRLEIAGLDWRWTLARAIAPAPGEVILDLGLGAGAAMPAMLARLAPGAQLIGLSPSERACARAEARAESLGVRAAILHAPVSQAARLVFEPPGRILVCLFDRADITPAAELLAAAREAAPPGGRLVVAALSQAQNADSALATLVRAVGFEGVEESALVPSPFGVTRVLAARAPIC